MAAARALAAAERPLLDGRVAAALPLVGPALGLAAALAEGDPLPRAAARALGGAVGGDVGARAGVAACGLDAAVTEGAGLLACPALTVAGGAAGSALGAAAAGRVYDAVAGRPERPLRPAR